MVKGAYTYSKTIDYTDDDGWAAVGWNWAPVFQRNRAAAGFDRTHVLQIGWLYELPFGKGKIAGEVRRRGSGPRRLAGERHHGGLHRHAVHGGCAGLLAQRAEQHADRQPGEYDRHSPRRRRTGPGLLRSDGVCVCDRVRFGSSGRNILRNPGVWNTDLDITRDFPIKERLKLQFRAEFFNLPNTSHFGGVQHQRYLRQPSCRSPARRVSARSASACACSGSIVKMDVPIGRAAMRLALFLFAAQFLRAPRQRRIVRESAAGQGADGLRPVRRGHSDLPATGEGAAREHRAAAQPGAGGAHGRPRAGSDSPPRSRPEGAAGFPARAALARLGAAGAEPARRPSRRCGKPSPPSPTTSETRGMLAGALLDAERFDQAGVEYRELTDAGVRRSARLVRARHDAIRRSPGRPSNGCKRPMPPRRTWRRWWPTRACSAGSIAAPSSSINEAAKKPAEPARDPRRAGRCLSQDRTRRMGRGGGREGARAARGRLQRPSGGMPVCRRARPADSDRTAPRTAGRPEALYWQAKAANELALQSFFRLGQLPPSVELHHVKAEIARAQGQHLESAREWRAALALSPGNPRLRRELAVSLFMAQDYRAALDEAGGVLKERSEVAGVELHRRRLPAAAGGAGEGGAVPQGGAGVPTRSCWPRTRRWGWRCRDWEARPRPSRTWRRRWNWMTTAACTISLARAYQAAGRARKGARRMAQYQEILKKNRGAEGRGGA